MFNNRSVITLMAVVAIWVTASGAAVSAPDDRKAGSPEENLPPNIERLTHFGERASWSPDGSRIAFMSKSFGDAFEVDVETGNIRLLTHYPNPGYLRVQYLPNGDFLLVGARKFSDIEQTRYSEQELWYLRDGGAEPIPLNQKLTEGIAISRDRMMVAWATDSRTHPEEIPSGEAIIHVGDIVEEDGKPKFVNKREVVHLQRPECVGGEPQDFRNNDSELIFVCYRLDRDKLPDVVLLADVMGVDLETGETTVYRKLPNEYNEPEGIFPDGDHLLVESSRNQETSTSSTIDIWKLRLEPDSKDFERLTRWGDYQGYKASNPVVSPDGTTIAFQSARSDEEAGVGHGIFLLRLE